MATELPPSLKSLSHFVKIGNEYASRDVVVHYWCLYRAVQEGMKLDKSSPGALNFLTTTLSILERIKSENVGVEALTQNIVAQAHIEDQAQRLFNYAESQDNASIFNMKVVKAFYTSGYLFDVLSVFGEPDENVQSAKKYAKWRSTYIFNCLKTGKQAVPGNQINQQQDNNSGDNLATNPIASVTADLRNFGLGERSTPAAGGTAFPSYPSTNQQHYQPDASAGYSGRDLSSSSSSAAAFIAGDGSGYPMQSGGYSQLPNQGNYGQLPNAGSSYGQQPAAGGIFGGPYGHQSAASAAGNYGVQPTVPTPIQSPSVILPSPQLDSRTEVAPSIDELTQAKKFVKYALSALDYDDAKTAVLNMQKALALLQK